jgi:3-deoxy-7-phosphoheptulonate synthase
MAKDSSNDPAASFFDDDRGEATDLRSYPQPDGKLRPYLIHLTGTKVGLAHLIDAPPIVVGRSSSCDLRIDEQGVSRQHVRFTRSQDGHYFVEDLQSSNGTLVNGRRIRGLVALDVGDKIQIGADTILKFAIFDEIEERYHSAVQQAIVKNEVPTTGHTTQRHRLPWFPSSWRSKEVAQDVPYDDPAELERVVTKLRKLPPLVTSWEVEDLKQLIAEAQQGKRFLLQGGDCAETHADCDPAIITNKLKIIIQMSLVLIRGLRRPVIRVGRFAGQYGKPRSKPTETKDGIELPSYFGDLVNRVEFSREARRPDPQRLLTSYYHSSCTLNFIRSVSSGDFADLRRPEYYDLSFSRGAELPSTLAGDYGQMCREITDGLQYLEAFGDRAADELMRVNFYASHEGLNLHYEEAQTRLPPRRERFYDLTTHMPWIGERTRNLDGAHIEFFRGIANPIGVKLGPTATREEVVELCRLLNPDDEPGKLILITRMGAKNVNEKLPPLIAAVRRAGARVLWVCDPMHGNAVTVGGIKTRNFEDILTEVQLQMEAHQEAGTYLGGVHFELTGDDVTECIGAGLTAADLNQQYATLCDPRLNYRQALQMAFLLAGSLGTLPNPSSVGSR